tara:strand:+ start:94 stop:783 length:690 start_codon:yes stop_codon:yes gene_type:complete
MSNVNKFIFQIHSSWKSNLKKFLEEDYFTELMERIDIEYSKFNIFPEKKLIFNAFKLTSFEKLKVVIIGQDPYFNKGQANGLCFSVDEKAPLPPSLKNIYKAVSNDIISSNFNHGDLSNWAKQGVLLLNTVLTVREGIPNSHKNFGWEKFTNRVVKHISMKKNNVCFLLWGNNAKKKTVLIDCEKHLVLTSVHPSPLSAHRGFLNCKHFSTTNNYLTSNGLQPIDWNVN